MADASSLSLGQASFSLDADTSLFGTPPEQIRVKPIGTGKFFVSNQSAGSPIENLTLDTALSPDISSNKVQFGSAVSGLDANLGDGADTLTIKGAVSGSTIAMDSTYVGGADRFVATGGFFESTVTTGAGNDTLIFAEEVQDSTVDTGAGNDQISVKSGSFVTATDFHTGDRNDILTFEGTVFVFGHESEISLGTGADTLIFGSNSFVSGYNIDLGSDNVRDKVFFNAGLDESNEVTISGANTGDYLFIGAGEFKGTYTFDGTDFSNDTDTLTWLT